MLSFSPAIAIILSSPTMKWKTELCPTITVNISRNFSSEMDHAEWLHENEWDLRSQMTGYVTANADSSTFRVHNNVSTSWEREKLKLVYKRRSKSAKTKRNITKWTLLLWLSFYWRLISIRSIVGIVWKFSLNAIAAEHRYRAQPLYWVKTFRLDLNFPPRFIYLFFSIFFSSYKLWLFLFFF